VVRTPPPEPGRIARRPHDKHGHPVPWFVAWVDGAPDYRLYRPHAIAEAINARLCWVCGIPFARQEPRVWVIGPMCAVNRISSEPPSHYDCAEYSARACPFLTTTRNPGVTLLWTSRYNGWGRVQTSGGLLFDVGPPMIPPEWFAEGRPATRAEVIESIDTGLPALREIAERQGDAGLDKLQHALADALALVPA
jgi:hypothetical protein